MNTAGSSSSQPFNIVDQVIAAQTISALQNAFSGSTGFTFVCACHGAHTTCKIHSSKGHF
jgi:hypothetical protein